MADLRRVYSDGWPQLRAGLIVVATIGGTLGLFAISAEVIGRTSGQFLKLTRPPTSEEVSAAVPVEYALLSTEKNDVVFLGDSTCLRGIDPIAFQQRCGLRAYNLGSLWALSIDGMLVTADAYLSRHPPPKLMVLCLCPEVPSHSAAYYPFAREFVSTYGRPLGIVPRAVRGSYLIDRETVREGAAIVLERLIASVPGRSDVRNSAIEGLSAHETLAGFAATRGIRRGHELLPGMFDPTARLDDVPGRPVSVLPEWRDGVQELARIIRQRNSRLMICLTPMRTDARSQNYDEVLAWLRDVKKEFPEAVINTELQFYDPPLCWDRRHLNSTGVKVFTEALAREIAAAIQPSSRKESQLEKMEPPVDSGPLRSSAAPRAGRWPEP